MKTKTIKQVLKKKFNDYVKTITDEHVQRLVKKNSIITGGAIASMLMQEEVNDYDVYFSDKETVIAVCQYYTQQFAKISKGAPSFRIIDADEGDVNSGRVKIRVQGQGIAAEPDFVFGDTPEGGTNFVAEEGTIVPPMDVSLTTPDGVEPKLVDGKIPYRPVYVSANAITLADDMQLIIRFYGDAEQIHENYDFAHCCCWWRSRDGHLELPSEALECLITKELRYKGSKYPLASIIRSRKFINRGFTINAGQYLKMCIQLNDMDLRSLEVLEDQLVGVDATYFANMLALMTQDRLSKDLDNSYFMSLIDDFF